MIILDYNEQPFLCPECGSSQADIVMEVSPIFNLHDPVANILEWIRCEQCHVNIPAHIAERWEGMTIEQAKQEWQDVYRRK